MPLPNASTNTTTSGSTTNTDRKPIAKVMRAMRTTVGSARGSRRAAISTSLGCAGLSGARCRVISMLMARPQLDAWACAQRCKRFTAKMITNATTSMTTAMAVASA